MAETTDIELLRDYALRNSEEAFATLVQRHIRLVYSVAFRRLGNTHQAEELTQAVFIILARKAAGFPSGTPLSGWLYQTARLTTANYLRGEMRRRRYEQEVHMQSEIRESHTEPVWQGLAPLLDEAMGELSGKERNAIVIRYFQGQTFSEVAAALGSNEAAVQKRVSRGVEKLRSFFAKRGYKTSAGVLVGLISTNSLQAVPAGLSGSVTASAMLKGATAGASTLTLIKGALKLMAWTKIKTALAIGACVLVAGTTAITISNFMDKSIRGIPPGWSALVGDPDAWHWAHGKINAYNDFGDSLLVSSNEYGNFTMSVIVTASTREASLAFHMQDANHSYLIVFCPVGTAWTAHNAAQLSLIKRVLADHGNDGEETLDNYRGSMKFADVGKRAKFEVTVVGSLIRVRLNGVKVLEARDDTYPTGRIGFRTYGDANIPSDATFSKLTIH
jgi:RNA polymerase sigma factor (sigma-70 family)